MAEKTSEYQDRVKKLELLEKNKINPYPAKVSRDFTIGEVLEDFKKLEKSGKEFFIVGRLRSLREHGNLIFADLQDESGRIQLAISKKNIGADEFKLFLQTIDISDFIEAKGKCFVTHKGQESFEVLGYRIISKALRPIPVEHFGLQDEEEKLRKRYLDILLNPELKELMKKRAKFWEVTRNFMKEKGFFEVETPTLEITTGGAEACPFKTHHNDFDIDVYMRISVGELWQKKLMAAGFEKTFEIGRVFRNEGSSPDHLQEFTNMEFYWAYANYENGMKLTQELYQEIAKKVFNTTKFKTRGYEFDLAGEWGRIDYCEEVKKQTGVDVIKDSEVIMKKKIKELKIKHEGENKERLTDTLWKYCRKNIAGPVFLINHPELVSPLAKRTEGNDALTQRFQIIIAGSEIGNGYSELNNPIDQRERFENQQKLLEGGDDEAMMPDWEFVEMLEHGMPPTCGFGFGERLFSFLADKTLREVTLFPLVKPR